MKLELSARNLDPGDGTLYTPTLRLYDSRGPDGDLIILRGKIAKAAEKIACETKDRWVSVEFSSFEDEEEAQLALHGDC